MVALLTGLFSDVEDDEFSICVACEREKMVQMLVQMFTVAAGFWACVQ